MMSEVMGDDLDPMIVDSVMPDIEEFNPRTDKRKGEFSEAPSELADVHLAPALEPADEPGCANAHKRAKVRQVEATGTKWEAQRKRLHERRETWHRRHLSQPRPQQIGSPDVFVHLPPETYVSFKTPEQEHQESLQESIQKLAELEKDKPLWDEAARTRQAREHAEAAERCRSKAQNTHEGRPSSVQAGPDVNMCQEEEDDANLKDYLFESRKRQHEKWAHVTRWTDAHAIQRYDALCETFDRAKFTQDNPPDFYEIPWPIIFSPNSTQAEDICWDSTEAFFLVAKAHIPAATYLDFVTKSHKRFHPDRWRSRNIVNSLAGRPSLQKLVEETGNTVSQALTPIWRQLKGD